MKKSEVSVTPGVPAVLTHTCAEDGNHAWMAQLDGPIAYTFVAISAFLGTRLFALFPHAVPSLARVTEVALIAVASIFCFARGWVVPVLVAAGMAAYALFLVYIPHAKFGSQFAPGSVASMLQICGVVALYPVLRTKPNRLFRFIYVLSVLYALVYCALSIKFMRDALGVSSDLLILSASGDRPDRVALSGIASISLCIAIAGIVRNRSYQATAVAALGAIALIFALSRTFTAISIVAYLTYVVSLKVRLVSVLSYWGFFCISAILFAFLFSGMNPFHAYFAGDASGEVRSIGFTMIQNIFSSNWLDGIGIEYIPEETARMMWFKFSPGDYGLVGVFITGGVIGVVIYNVIAYLCAFSETSLQTLHAVPAYRDGLVLFGCLVTFDSIISPTLWVEGGGLVGGLYIAVALAAAERRQLLSQRHPQFVQSEHRTEGDQGIAQDG